jgi:hypothetical protein
MEKMAPALQQKDKRSPRNRRDGLYEGAGEGKERGDYEGHVAESSLYTEASIHPVITGALLLGAGLALAAFIREQSKSE